MATTWEVGPGADSTEVGQMKTVDWVVFQKLCWLPWVSRNEALDRLEISESKCGFTAFSGCEHMRDVSIVIRQYDLFVFLVVQPFVASLLECGERDLVKRLTCFANLVEIRGWQFLSPNRPQCS